MAFLRSSVLRGCFWLTELNACCVLALVCWGVWSSLNGGLYGSFVLVPLKMAWGTLDSGIAVHSTDKRHKQEDRMVHVYQFPQTGGHFVDNDAHGASHAETMA